MSILFEGKTFLLQKKSFSCQKRETLPKIMYQKRETLPQIMCQKRETFLKTYIKNVKTA